MLWIDPRVPIDVHNDDVRTSDKRHRLGFVALGMLALLVFAMAINTFHAAYTRRNAEAWHLHTLEVLLVAEQVRSAANEALRGERGYLITGDERFLEPYERGVRQAPRLAATLRRLTSDNPVQLKNMDALDAQLASYLAVLARTIAFTRNGRNQDAIAIVRSGIGRREIELLLAIVERIDREERRLLTARQHAASHADNASEVADFALLFCAFLFLGIAAWAGVSAAKARTRTLAVKAQLRRVAMTDELTELLNRRAFLAAVDTELARASRSGAPLAVALIDLDHFKSVNDRFGHHGGDSVLRRFAEIARETMRTSDVIGRLGGEEFAVLMPDTDPVEAGIAAERLRTAIARRNIILETGALVPVTVSIGVAHPTAGEDRDRLIIRADEALYEAKNGGRNRTRLAA